VSGVKKQVPGQPVDHGNAEKSRAHNRQRKGARWIRNAFEKLARVTSECERPREENSRLRKLLNQSAPRSMESLVAAEQGRPEPTQASPEAMPSRSESATPELSVAGKIALFRSLFRGRDDESAGI
jgi:hypothetical protein